MQRNVRGDAWVREQAAQVKDHVDRAETLIRGFLDVGDVDGAFVEAYASYGAEVHRWLASVLKNAAAADDVLQDGMVQLWINLHRGFRPELKVRTWCFKVARQQLWQRRRKGAPELPQTVATRISQVADDQRSARSLLISAEQHARLRGLLDGLDSDDRTLFLLRIDHLMSYAEIAAIMDVNPAALRQRFGRLQDELRRRTDALDSTPP